jgi:hypothetical protein
MLRASDRRRLRGGTLGDRELASASANLDQLLSENDVSQEDFRKDLGRAPRGGAGQGTAMLSFEECCRPGPISSRRRAGSATTSSAAPRSCCTPRCSSGWVAPRRARVRSATNLRRGRARRDPRAEPGPRGRDSARLAQARWLRARRDRGASRNPDLEPAAGPDPGRRQRPLARPAPRPRPRHPGTSSSDARPTRSSAHDGQRVFMIATPRGAVRSATPRRWKGEVKEAPCRIRGAIAPVATARSAPPRKLHIDKELPRRRAPHAPRLEGDPSQGFRHPGRPEGGVPRRAQVPVPGERRARVVVPSAPTTTISIAKVALPRILAATSRRQASRSPRSSSAPTRRSSTR